VRKEIISLIFLCFLLLPVSSLDGQSPCKNGKTHWMDVVLLDLALMDSDIKEPDPIQISPLLMDAPSTKKYYERFVNYLEFKRHFDESMDYKDAFKRSYAAPAAGSYLDYPIDLTYQDVYPLSWKDCKDLISSAKKKDLGDLEARESICLSINSLETAFRALERANLGFGQDVKEDADHVLLNDALSGLGYSNKFVLQEETPRKSQLSDFLRWKAFVFDNLEECSDFRSTSETGTSIPDSTKILSSKEDFNTNLLDFRRFNLLSSFFHEKISEKEFSCRENLLDLGILEREMEVLELWKIPEEVIQDEEITFSTSPSPNLFLQGEKDMEGVDCKTDLSFREGSFMEASRKLALDESLVEKERFRLERERWFFQNINQTVFRLNHEGIVRLLPQIGDSAFSSLLSRNLMISSDPRKSLGQTVLDAYLLRKEIQGLDIPENGLEASEGIWEELILMVEVACSEETRPIFDKTNNRTLYGEGLSQSKCEGYRKDLADGEADYMGLRSRIMRDTDLKWEKKVNALRLEIKDRLSRLRLLIPNRDFKDVRSDWVSARGSLGQMAYLYKDYARYDNELETLLSETEKDYGARLDYLLSCTAEEDPPINKEVTVYCSLSVYNPTYLKIKMKRDFKLPYFPSKKVGQANILMGGAEISSDGLFLEVEDKIFPFSSSQIDFQYLSVPQKNDLTIKTTKKDNKIIKTYFFKNPCDKALLEIEAPKVYFTKRRTREEGGYLKIETDCTPTTIEMPYVSFSERRDGDLIKLTLKNLFIEPLEGETFSLNLNQEPESFPLDYSYESGRVIFKDTIYDEKTYEIRLGRTVPECKKDYPAPCTNLTFSEIQFLEEERNEQKSPLPLKTNPDPKTASKISKIAEEINLLKSAKDRFGYGRTDHIEEDFETRLSQFEEMKNGERDEVKTARLESWIGSQKKDVAEKIYKLFEKEELPQILSVPEKVKDTVESIYNIRYEAIEGQDLGFLELFKEEKYSEFIRESLKASKDIEFSDQVKSLKKEAEIALYTTQSIYNKKKEMGFSSKESERYMQLSEDALKEEKYYDALYYAYYARHLQEDAEQNPLIPLFSPPFVITLLTGILAVAVHISKKNEKKSLFRDVE
jgi:hypothetical protein